MSKLSDLRKNINKTVEITESTIIGLTGKQGVIKEVIGTEHDGYRYQVELAENLSDLYPRKTFFPACFNCKIVRNG